MTDQLTDQVTDQVTDRVTDQYAEVFPVPAEELAERATTCRRLLQTLLPEAEGMLVLSRLNIFYFSGTLANGLLWLPREGDPVLLCRRGEERARIESTLTAIGSYRSYGDLPALFAELGAPLGRRIGVEKGGLPWNLAELLQHKLPGVEMVAADQVLARARAVKTPYEQRIMARCGEAHHAGLYHDLPRVLRPGMSEREIALAAWDVFFARGHQGMMRMGNPGEEIFLGHVAAGDAANYPSVFNGPVGLVGENPASPFMGSPSIRWEKNQLLTCDIGFALDGYCTDKTQVYYSGKHLPDEISRGHAFCVRMQERLAERPLPGAIPEALYAEVMALADTEGVSEGFMALGKNKVAFLGHGIGLTIDGWPVIARGFREPLEAGMTLALEPKFGIPGKGMCGVENTFLVTEQGGVCLTGDAFDIVRVE